MDWYDGVQRAAFSGDMNEDSVTGGVLDGDREDNDCLEGDLDDPIAGAVDVCMGDTSVCLTNKLGSYDTSSEELLYRIDVNC